MGKNKSFFLENKIYIKIFVTRSFILTNFCPIRLSDIYVEDLVHVKK